MMFMPSFFLIFCKKKHKLSYSFELHQQVDAIQMVTHNICLYKEVDKQFTGCNLKTTRLLHCALRRVWYVFLACTPCNHPKFCYFCIFASKALIYSAWQEILPCFLGLLDNIFN